MVTFDDGPDEIYTPKLLDVLSDHSVKATFFVVAKNAEKNPNIIARMKNDGHTIALHSLEHRNALLYSYKYTKKDFEKSIDTSQLMENCGSEIRDCQTRVNQHIARALTHSASAKATHDLLEAYYVPAMDFSKVESKLKSVLEKILSYVEEQAVAVVNSQPTSKL